MTTLPIAMTIAIALAGIVAAPRRTLTRATLSLTFATVAALSALFCARTLDAVALLLPVSLLPCWFTVADPQARPELRAACGWLLAGTGMPLIVVAGLRASGVDAASPIVASLVLTALLVRLAIPPFHGWLPVLLEHAPPSLALLVASTSVTPFLLAHVLWPSASVVLEQARPVLVALGLAGSLYGALLGLVQTHLRRAVGYVLVSQWGAVLVALAAATPESTTGALLASVALGLTSSALVILAWAIENRTGSASMDHQGGLVAVAPHLAVAFLAFGFAHVGFPGSLAFVAEDLMLHGVLAGHPIVGGFVLAASALNAITVFRAYQRTFLGPRPAGAGAISDLVPRERAVAAILLVLVMLAGVFPGPIVSWALRGVVPGPHAEARRSESPRG